METTKKNPELVATTSKVAFAVGGLSAAAYILGTALTVVALNPVAFAIGALIALAAYFAITSKETTLFGKALDGIVTAAAPGIDALKDLFETLTGIHDIYSKIGNLLGWKENAGPNLNVTSDDTVAKIQDSIQRQAKQIQVRLAAQMKGNTIQTQVGAAARPDAMPVVTKSKSVPSGAFGAGEQDHRIAITLDNILRLMRGSMPRTVPADP